MEGFLQQGNYSQSTIEIPNVEGQDQRVEGIGRGAFLLSFLNSPFCRHKLNKWRKKWENKIGENKTKAFN